MANARFYSNTAQQTTLGGSISAGATSISVAATTGFPGSFPYTLAVDYGSSTEELVNVTAAAGTTLTVTRGYGSTSAQSHSLGAVVRHVYDATDATDYRTHEAATSGIHGVAGTLVGTSDTQTLANKTLTAPTITNPTVTGGGSLAGTFTGTPTFSGVITYTAAVQSTQSAAANTTLGAIVSGDTFDRFRILADGDMEWGPGNGARDVQLYRDAANVLATNDTFRVYGAATSTDAFQARVTGDTVSRLNIDADGVMSWGPGGASAQDTNLYRSFANELQTDSNFTVIGNLEVGGTATVTGTLDAATASTTTGVTAASGWSATIQALRVTSGVSTVNITLNRTGADLASGDLGGSSGNISPDIEVCTIPAAWRPPADLYVLASTGIGHGSIRIQTDGSCQLLTWIPSQGITSGSNLRFTYTFSS